MQGQYLQSNVSTATHYTADPAIIRICYECLAAGGVTADKLMELSEMTLEEVVFDINGIHVENADGYLYYHPLTGQFMNRLHIALETYVRTPFMMMFPNAKYVELKLQTVIPGMVVFQICHMD